MPIIKKSLRLMTLNMEVERHTEKVRALLLQEVPDIACLQEVSEQKIQNLAKETKMEMEFRHMGTQQGRSIGLAILWSDQTVKPTGLHIVCYAGKDAYGEHEWDPNLSETYARILLAMDFEKDSQSFLIANTHFTWSPDGNPTNSQREDVVSLLHQSEEWAKRPSGLIITGDFNAPRGGEIHNEIIKHYLDHLPLSVETTLDQILHRAAPLNRVVDTFFSTPHYYFKNVRVISGVSDHCAIIADVSR